MTDRAQGVETDVAEELIRKAERREALFGIVGLGYVGLPLALELAKAGYRVLGFDISERVVNSLNAGHSHVKDISDELLRDVVADGRFEATRDMDRMGEPDVVSICCADAALQVQGPRRQLHRRGHRCGQAHRSAGARRSSSNPRPIPGTTREILQPALESTGLKVGHDFFLAFSPERVDPGNPTWQTHNTPKVVGGITPRPAPAWPARSISRRSRRWSRCPPPRRPSW